MRKRFSKYASLFLVAGLSLSMVTGCGSKSDDDNKDKDDKVQEQDKDNNKDSDKDTEKDSDKDEAQDEEVTADSISQEFAESNFSDIKLDGTSVKFIVDVEAKSGEETMKANANVKLDIRTNPELIKMTADVSGDGMEEMDIEGYLFVEDGKLFVEMRNEDGTYKKAAIQEDGVDDALALIPEDDKTLFTKEDIEAMAEQLKGLDSVGKNTVDGKEYDTLETKIAEKDISSTIDALIPTIVGSIGEQYGISEETVDVYKEMIPKGYGDVTVDVYFDEGIFSGASIDLSNLVKSASEDDGAKCKISVIFGYNDTTEITIPEATEAELDNLLQ